MIDVDGFRLFLYQEEMSPNTIASYCESVKRYAADHDEIDKSELIAYKHEQLAKYKPSTVNLRIAAILAYCRYKNIPIRLKSIKIPRITSVENVITVEQLDDLLCRLKKDGDRCWYVNILLLSKTGMRISEAMRVTKRDILKGRIQMMTKGKIRTIYFPKSLVDAIKPDLAKLSVSDCVMRCHKGRRTAYPKQTKPFSSHQAVRNGMAYIGKRYGFPPEVMHPHSLRHLFAIEFLKRNHDIALLSDLLGHSNVSTTQIYLRLSSEQQAQEVDKTVDW